MVTCRNALQRMAAPGPRAVGAACVLACLILTLLAVKTPWAPLPRAVIAAAGLVSTGAVWFRDRWPVAVAALGAAGYALSGNPGPLLIGLFSGALRRQGERSGGRPAERPGARSGVGRGARFAVLAVIGVAGFLGQQWVESGRVGAGGLLPALVATTAVLMTGGYAATRRELTSSLRERAERAEAERHLREEQARAAERGRIAREMHDVLAHKVTLISLHAGGLEVNPGAEAARIEREAALIRATAQEALEELRAIIGVLRAGHDDEFPDLRRLVDTWASAGNAVTLRGDLGALPVAAARAAYRLAQEGLTNARRHAPGAPVTVSVTASPRDGVTITVANEPPPPLPAPSASAPAGTPAGTLTGTPAGTPAGTLTGTPAGTPAGAGAGLVGLAERFRLLGGTVRGTPGDAGGWRLEGRLPWDASARDTHDQDAAGG
ncbi:sensor histidine kinase [Nonomuraea sp. NPDC050783]|uniref:sensor histidine kinase n=1 Tax=Nonomuraea sp. NPDC050783 TaxID=3154634 RepID=UPI00346788B6